MRGDQGAAGNDLDMIRSGKARDARVIDKGVFWKGEVDGAARGGRCRRVAPEVDFSAEPVRAANGGEQRQHAAGAEQEDRLKAGRAARKPPPSGPKPPAQPPPEH